MSCNLHGRGCIDTRVDEVANGGATEIMGDKAFVLIPRFPCLFSEKHLLCVLFRRIRRVKLLYSFPSTPAG